MTRRFRVRENRRRHSALPWAPHSRDSTRLRGAQGLAHLALDRARPHLADARSEDPPPAALLGCPVQVAQRLEAGAPKPLDLPRTQDYRQRIVDAMRSCRPANSRTTCGSFLRRFAQRSLSSGARLLPVPGGPDRRRVRRRKRPVGRRAAHFSGGHCRPHESMTRRTRWSPSGTSVCRSATAQRRPSRQARMSSLIASSTARSS